MVQVEPTGSLMKRMGCCGVERAEPVVVDDLGDGDLVGAGHGLGEFVVVDEHEAGLHGLEHVALREDALQRALVVGDEQGVRRAGGEFLADVGDAGVGADGGEVALDHALDGRGGADDPRGGGGVVGADDEADALRLRECDDFGVDLEVAGDDEGADAELDRAAPGCRGGRRR